MTPRTLLAAAALALTAPAAPADERDDRIDRLERETADLRRQLVQLREQRTPASDAGAIRAAVDGYLARGPEGAGGSPGPAGALRRGVGVTFGGYFSTRYLASQASDAKPSFVDMRLVPKIHADVTERIAFDGEIELEHGGVSDEVDGEIVVEQAELSFRLGDGLTFKAGTLLVPFGAFNQNHDDPMNELSSRPDVARFVVPSAFAVPGVGARGSVDLDDDTAFTYDAVLTNGFRDEFNADEGTRAARGLFEEDDNHDKTVFGRVGLVPTLPFLDAANVGVSGALGKVGAPSDRLRGYGVDAAAKHGSWEFKGEFDQFGIDRGPGAAPPVDGAGNLGPTRGVRGWFAQVVHRITEPWVRSLPCAEEDASLALVLRRDAADLNDRVHGASPRDDERAWSVGVTYRPTGGTAVKLEYRRASSGASGSAGSDRDLFAVEFATYF